MRNSAVSSNLNKYFFYSLAIHGLIVIFFSILFYTFKEQLEVIKAKNLKLIESSVRVDVVSMPELTMKELKQIEMGQTLNEAEVQKAEPELKQPEQIESTPAKPDEIVIEKKAPKKQLFDVLKQISDQSVKEQVAKNKVAPKKGLDKQQLASLKQLAMAGNKLSKGQAVVIDGNAGENQGEVDSYLAQVPAWVRPNWQLPSYLINKDLKCRIRIFVDGNGRIINALVYESSGDPDYDERALEAVNKSGPFPAPSKALRSMLLNGELLLGFPL